MSSRKSAYIIGIGSYLPSKVLSNADLEKMVDTNDEWITTRTGIKERRIAGQEEFASDMGAKAAQKALTQSGMMPEDIDLILVATMTPDRLLPSTAALLQHQIGAKKAAAMDLQAACTGFLYGLSTAKAFIESGTYKNVLLVASEKMSAFVDYQDRNTCVLFGDGAAAVVLSDEVTTGLSIDSICLGADGAMSELLQIPAGGTRQPASPKSIEDRAHFIKMEGKEIFKYAVRQMSSSAKECLAKAKLEDSQISWLVSHQANERIMDAVAKNFNIASNRVYKTVAKYGNTSASSIAIALDELLQNEELKTGEHLLLVAFGGGLTWGASLLTKI